MATVDKNPGMKPINPNDILAKIDVDLTPFSTKIATLMERLTFKSEEEKQHVLDIIMDPTIEFDADAGHLTIIVK